MKIQLNINMGIGGQSRSEPWLGQRYVVIHHLLANNTDWTVLKASRVDRQVEHLTQDLLILEQVFVAEIACAKFTEDMRQFLSSLADVLGQGCIAVYHPSTEHGTLIGSNPGPWGEFDLDRFITMDEVPA